MHCRALVHDPDKITVDIGLGNHVELTLEEGIRFTEKKIQHLENDILPSRVEKAQRVAADVEGALTLLETIGKELNTNQIEGT